jgi:hypothetical protein
MLLPPLGWYALGFGIMEKGGWMRFGHYGSNEGYRCSIGGYPTYAQYEGRYRHADQTDYSAAIVKEGERLTMQGMPDGVRYALYPASETTFFCLKMSEQIAFARAGDGHVEAMTIGEHWRLEREV